MNNNENTKRVFIRDLTVGTPIFHEMARGRIVSGGIVESVRTMDNMTAVVTNAGGIRSEFVRVNLSTVIVKD